MDRVPHIVSGGRLLATDLRNAIGGNSPPNRKESGSESRKNPAGSQLLVRSVVSR